jgi:hypothetical protein
MNARELKIFQDLLDAVKQQVDINNTGASLTQAVYDAEKWLDEQMVECPLCSLAGGAGLPVRHLPPVCGAA